jgi:hypothetical protein
MTMIGLRQRSYKKCEGREMEKMRGWFALGCVRPSDVGVAEFVSKTEIAAGFFAVRHFRKDRFSREACIV